jgi:hypothetical protein
MLQDIVPKDIAERTHFYGVIETPNDIVKFYCNYYTVNNSVVTIYDFLVDNTATNKAPFLQKGQLFYNKIEIIGYMAVFTPYTPYKYREKGGETE